MLIHSKCNSLYLLTPNSLTIPSPPPRQPHFFKLGSIFVLESVSDNYINYLWSISTFFLFLFTLPYFFVSLLCVLDIAFEKTFIKCLKSQMNVFIFRDAFGLLLSGPSGRKPFLANLTVWGGLAHPGYLCTQDALHTKANLLLQLLKNEWNFFLFMVLFLFPALFSRKTDFSTVLSHWKTERQFYYTLSLP